MASTAIITMTKMLESLPKHMQDEALEQLHALIAEMQDEQEWDSAFSRTQNGLIAAAKQARQEIEAGNSSPMNFDKQ